MDKQTDILTPEQVRESCSHFPDCWTLQVVAQSHEALRSLLAARDRDLEHWKQEVGKLHSALAARDRTIADWATKAVRAEEARAELQRRIELREARTQPDPVPEGWYKDPFPDPSAPPQPAYKRQHLSNYAITPSTPATGEYCDFCDAAFGPGSHYHCPNCGDVCGMLGHHGETLGTYTCGKTPAPAAAQQNGGGK